MATVVVKLGSSIVADDLGEVRMDVLATLCDEVAARHAAGDELVVVTSGAIARGMRLMELPVRPSTMEELAELSHRSQVTRPLSTMLRMRPADGPVLSCTQRKPGFSAMNGSP